jgi:hypothetical protein
MFLAVEVAAKVLFPRKFAGLAANEVDKQIRPVLDRAVTSEISRPSTPVGFSSAA